MSATGSPPGHHERRQTRPRRVPVPTETEQPVIHSHCPACGASYTGLPSPDTWPRTCAACGETAYRNPLPVAVALLPVTDGDTTGLVVITRTIEPARGGLALPGGFIDHAEDWQHAVVRELREETRIEARPEDVRLADALSSPAGHLLLFGLLPERPATAHDFMGEPVDGYRQSLCILTRPAAEALH
ncbi:NUDIX domain-containing protein, partial [Streptomyces sp. col6]|uniref:NUDIX domain-containing protein n=1 Tax=Streptomyces sp. col6 TaxID=2478958 RepID=UPI001CD16988